MTIIKKNKSTLNTAPKRLSSGLRINSAKDDAAGQSIANRFTAQQRGSLQAARNANDGISLSQTTQGYLDEINPRLQHVRELTVQGLNSSYTPKDKDQTQTEIHRTQLQDDITHNQSNISLSYQYHGR